MALEINPEQEAAFKNGWLEYKRLVLETMTDLKTSQSELKEELVLARIEIGKLQVKAAILGAFSGALPGIAIAILTLLLTRGN